MKFILPLPPTLNHTYKMGRGKYYKDQKAVNWEEEVGWVVRQKKPLLGPLKVQIYMFLNRDRDIDSSLKLVLDTMAKVGVYNNDNQIVFLNVEKKVDKGEPRMVVEVEKLQ